MKYFTVRQNPSSEYPPSVRRQWIWGFHSRGRPKVWRTQIKPGTKFFDLFREKKSCFMTSETASKRQLSRSRSSRKKMAKGFVDGEDKMPVSALNQFEGHGSRPVVGIFSATGRAKFGMAAERNKLESTAMGAAIHGSAIRRVTAVDHFFNVFHDNRSGLQVVFNNFIIVF